MGVRAQLKGQRARSTLSGTLSWEAHEQSASHVSASHFLASWAWPSWSCGLKNARSGPWYRWQDHGRTPSPVLAPPRLRKAPVPRSSTWASQGCRPPPTGGEDSAQICSRAGLTHPLGPAFFCHAKNCDRCGSGPASPVLRWRWSAVSATSPWAVHHLGSGNPISFGTGRLQQPSPSTYLPTGTFYGSTA
jgi:hypothetical protein